MTLFDVKEFSTTGSNPKANGLTKNCNKLIENYLTSYVSFADEDWDICCLELAFTCNSSLQFLPIFTSVRLMFAREDLVPCSIKYTAWSN